MRERQANQQIRRPAVDVANQPAERHLGDDELDALVRLAGARTVVEQQQNAGEDLNGEQEQRHAAEVIPDLLRVDRHAFLRDEMPHVGEIETFVKPGEHLGNHALDTTISAASPSPRMLTVNFSRPRGGGPETTFPPRSYVPL